LGAGASAAGKPSAKNTTALGGAAPAAKENARRAKIEIRNRILISNNHLSFEQIAKPSKRGAKPLKKMSMWRPKLAM
jgi:hypothetical protein